MKLLASAKRLFGAGRGGESRDGSVGARADAHGTAGAAALERARALQTRAMARRLNRSVEALPLYREALGHFRAAARLQPERAQAHSSCGTVLLELGELEAARASFAEAYRLDPDAAAVAAGYAGALEALGDARGAIAVYENALRRHPQDPSLHGGLALALLGRGEFERGWLEYEWRFRLPQPGLARPFPFPRWNGEPLAGATLLVSSEQGIGDEIMFASCFDELIAAAGHCVLEASTRLVPLFTRSFPRATILPRSLERMPDWSALPRIDWWITAGSVPRLLRSSQDRFPRRERYLSADPGRVAHWRERLANLGSGRKIGLAWTGGVPATMRAARSMELAELRPLVGAGVCVALEYLDCSAEVEAFHRGGPERLHWWPEALGAMDETAALVSALDLAITVTTTAAHLAGALGRPVWVLVPSVPSWRYLWQGDRMPWYPTMRVFRGAGRARSALVLEVRKELGTTTREPAGAEGA